MRLEEVGEAVKPYISNPFEFRPRGRRETPEKLLDFENRHLVSTAEHIAATVVLGGLAYLLKSGDFVPFAVLTFLFSGIHSFKADRAYTILKRRYNINS